MPASSGKKEENNNNAFSISSSNFGEEDDGMIREGGSDDQREIQMQQNLNTVDGVTVFAGNASANDAQFHAYSQMSQPHTSERNQQENNRVSNVPAAGINSQPTSYYHGSDDAAARIERNQQDLSNTPARKISSQPTSSYGPVEDAKINEARRMQVLEYERLHQMSHSRTTESNQQANIDDVQVQAYSQLSQPHTSERNQQEHNHDSSVLADRINSQSTSCVGSDDVTARIGNTERGNDSISDVTAEKVSSQPTPSSERDSDDANFKEARRRQVLEYERLNRAHIEHTNSGSKPAARATDPFRYQSTPSLTHSDEMLANSGTSGNNTQPIIRDTDPPALQAQRRDADSLAIQAQIRAYEQLTQAHMRHSLSHINHNSPQTPGSKYRHSSPESQSSRSLNALDGMDRSIASFGNETNNLKTTQDESQVSELDRLRKAGRTRESEMQMTNSQSARSLEILTESASRALKAQKLEYERLQQAHANAIQNRQGSENANNQQDSSMAMDDDSSRGNDEANDRKAPF